ncbi:glycosyltransferase family 2 protein [Desulfurococcus sp.]|uniref:glycosyltransferase family 2 protein n=1 Tax=Desulfurococcus sp. TaxID=51678 RepID=UPI003166C727
MGSEGSIRGGPVAGPVGVDLSDVTVLIPTLNEAAAIGRVIDEVLEVGVPAGNILVVDGGSNDGTVNIARSRGVRVVLQEGRGKAMAVKTGLKHVETRFVVVMDGDYTYPAKYIPVLVSRLGGGECDLVIGVRLLGKGSQKPLFRLGNRAITFVFNTLFGAGLRDVLSGMYAAESGKLRQVGYEMHGFSVESEIAAHFASTGTVCEELIEYRPRLDPRSKKLRVPHGFKIAWDIVRLTWRYNPAFFIFGLGALLLIPGLALGAYVAYHYFYTGINYYVKGLVAIMLTLAGFQSLIAAILALYLKRAEKRYRDYVNELIRQITKQRT